MPESIRHRFFASVYPRVAKIADEKGGAEHRRELVAGLTGRVVEVGAGNGRNFRHYPDTVSEVVAVEPEPTLRARAEQAATRAPVPVQVAAGSADELPLDDESFDAVVLSLVLCSVPDPARALAEVRRVLRPHGEARFYEHVLSDRPRLARLQRSVDVVWPKVAGGCHVSRDTLTVIETAGFDVISSRAFPFKASRLVKFAEPHVLGTARLAHG